jgi:Mn2+/Fe2+ NRAMP family transporter
VIHKSDTRAHLLVPTFAPVRWMRLLLRSLGPGVITGAADDDPSSIATYSVAGAQLGTKLLWTALLTWPLMAAVQMMCARIGKVTGQGLAGNLKQRFPRWLLGVFIVALLVANTINIAADLAGMADAASKHNACGGPVYGISEATESRGGFGTPRCRSSHQ